MSKDTIRYLYKCFDCKRQVYYDDIHNGKYCKCGSLKVRLLAPTLWRIIKEFIFCKSSRDLFIKENFLKFRFRFIQKSKKEEL
jgi:DNA-directed RNA polymerase subunit RPC12/RpoP